MDTVNAIISLAVLFNTITVTVCSNIIISDQQECFYNYNVVNHMVPFLGVQDRHR